jgi:hypothetical protein
VSRWRWVVWVGFVVAWTVALLYPVVPHGGVERLREESFRYFVAKTVHLSAYAVFTILTGWLRAPLRFRPLLMFVLMAHATATEMGQWWMNDVMHWSERTGHLHDVAYDNVGVLLGLLVSWKWWVREG